MKILSAALVAAVLLVVRPIVAGVPLPGDADVPVPPEQTRPWVPPPTSLPAEVVSATAALFEDGMADPRGCEYREVQLVLGRGAIKENGWVLPGDEKGPRYAIGWNGVIYPVKTVGALATLSGDGAPLAKSRFSRNGGDYPMGDYSGLATRMPLPIKVALLLRLDDLPLAESVWQDGCRNDDALVYMDPFPVMAGVWLEPQYDHAVQAYLRDDYPRALALCRSLSPAVAKALETARARGRWDPWPEHQGGLRLWELPILMAEVQRRMAEPPGESVLDSGKPGSGPERIAALVRDLQQVRATQWVNPGSTDVSEDPVVQALVKEGEEAVAPLLQCLVEDNRLTRSMYTQGMSEGGPIIPVYEAAYTALFGILDVSFPPVEHDGEDSRWRKEPRHLGPEDRRALASKLEGVWREKRGKDPLETAYAALRDDAAGADAWFQAIDDIVQPDDGTFTPYRLMLPAMRGSWRGHDSNKPFTARGESLRSRTDPSVTELMIRRFEQLTGDMPPTANQGMARMKASQDLSRLGKLLLSLADWDGRSHLDDLRRLEHELQAKFRQQGANVFDTGDVVLDLFEKRLQLGDATALGDYADHVEGLTPGNLSTNYGSAPGCFRLMWQHPDAPIMVRTAEKMFGLGSPWVPFVRGNSQNLAYLVRTPLVGMTAFRRELERGLGDTFPSGEMILADNGQLAEGTSRLYTLDPLAPPKGSKITYRLCDHYAHELSSLDGFPRCELYWPLADRDHGVEASRAFLDRYGDNFRAGGKEDHGFKNPYPTAGIHFAALDGPATAEDVGAGRAIFSLPAPSRVCRLPALPLAAERPGRKEDPCRYENVTEDGTPTSTISYTTRGTIWQAEETLVNGKWERYYGFVGRYQLEKVPAAEIEFPANRSGTDVAPGISGEIERVSHRPDDPFFWNFAPRDFVSSGAPVHIRVKLDNHSGLDRIVPGALMLPPGANNTLPPGIGLALSYTEKLPPRVQRFSDPPFDFGTWREVPLREGVRTAGSTVSAPSLGPTDTLTILEIDLRDYFDLGRTGSYRLKALFHVPGEAAGQSSEITFSVDE